MKRYIHVSTARIAWAMQIADAMFLPDAARPESGGLVYEPIKKVVRVVGGERGDVKSSGGVGAWVVEVVPGEFEVVSHEVFQQTYQSPGAAPPPDAGAAPHEQPSEQRS